MIITFTETEAWEQEFFAGHLQDQQVTFFPSPLDIHHIPKDTEILSSFIYSQITKDVLNALPSLKLIVTRSTGMDHIDTEACKEKKIQIVNVPAYGVNTIAEHTFSLILALSRKIIPSVQRTQQGNFSLDGLRGLELANKTIGIVGFGSIGKRVAEISKAFKLTIIVHTSHPTEQLKDQYAVEFVDLPTLLRTSDIVTLHVPSVPETQYLINKGNIGTMKRGSILINTARGAIVETEAIVWALEQEILSGAGLDVLEEEKALKEERQLLTKEYIETGNLRVQLLNHVLLHREDVIITPHNAFNSQAALQEILDQTLKAIVQYTHT